MGGWRSVWEVGGVCRGLEEFVGGWRSLWGVGRVCGRLEGPDSFLREL